MSRVRNLALTVLYEQSTELLAAGFLAADMAADEIISGSSVPVFWVEVWRLGAWGLGFGVWGGAVMIHACRREHATQVLEALYVLISPNTAQRHALHVERTADKASLLSGRV